jgi:hypothetical protein
MSWSVGHTGTSAEVRGKLSEQFKYPLAEKPKGLSDDGERKTVPLVHELLEQILTTVPSGHKVNVTAYGHMASSEGQQVNLTVTPVSM